MLRLLNPGESYILMTANKWNKILPVSCVWCRVLAREV